MVVSGEAGIGKSRLCAEVAARARRTGFTVVWGSCWLDGGAPPLWPWQSLLAERCGPSAAALLDGAASVAGVEPDRFGRFVAVTEALGAACAADPTLLVIDDVQAAQAEALLLLRFVHRALRHRPLVLLVTRRPVTRDPEVTALLDGLEDEATTLPLRGFDVPEAMAFVRSTGNFDPEAELVETLLHVTGGNPLHLRRVLVLDRSDAPASALPKGVRGAIQGAADRLPRNARRILRVAAVLGTAPAVRDTAAVTGTTAAAVLDAIEQGAAVGLVEAAGPDALRFSHELVREVLEAGLAPGERLDAHARAAAVIGADVTSRPERLARRAHHALRAAVRSAEDAAQAVPACRAAAAAMNRGLAYAQAAALLGEAVAVLERADLAVPAALLVDHADAVLSCGRLRDARVLADRAAATAQGEGDAVLLALAALVLGGVWVGEHRATLDHERVLGLQRRALAGLPEDAAILRCRLRVRLAAEAAYPGGAVDELLIELERARALGDGRALAEALSYVHHVLLTPGHLAQRLPLADELIRVASVTGEGVLATLGLCLRAVDLYHLADPQATRALAEFRARADALGCQSLLYVAAVMEVMVLLRQGWLDKAETSANACLALGTEVGDADAPTYLAGHLISIRWAQGREDELLGAVEEFVSAPTPTRADFSLRAAAAMVAARGGKRDQARVLLDQVTSGGLAGLPQTSGWLVGMLAIVETAAVLADTEVAEEARWLLLPYAEQPVMPSLAIACFGSTERPLGLAALTCGDLNAAVGHLERALAANLRLANRPVTAITRADLADALRRRDASGDREQATALLAQAIDEARTMGMASRAEVWQAALDDLRSAAPALRKAQLARDGAYWLLTFEGRRVVLADRVGVRYLAQLLATPGVALPVLELAGSSLDVEPTGHAVLDAQARVAYERRARGLAEDLSEAESHADLARAERLRVEFDALASELARAIGLAGRTRSFAGPAERARTAVRKALKRVLDEVDAADAHLGAHLRATVSTGTTCSYAPDAREGIAWSATAASVRVPATARDSRGQRPTATTDQRKGSSTRIPS